MQLLLKKKISGATQMNNVLHILVLASGLAEDKMQLGLNPATSESTTSPRQT